jgi:hypothetical protein
MIAILDAMHDPMRFDPFFGTALAGRLERRAE